MPRYAVTLVLEVTADTPEEAAREAPRAVDVHGYQVTDFQQLGDPVEIGLSAYVHQVARDLEARR